MISGSFSGCQQAWVPSNTYRPTLPKTTLFFSFENEYGGLVVSHFTYRTTILYYRPSHNHTTAVKTAFSNKTIWRLRTVSVQHSLWLDRTGQIGAAGRNRAAFLLLFHRTHACDANAASYKSRQSSGPLQQCDVPLPPPANSYPCSPVLIALATAVICPFLITKCSQWSSAPM